MRLFHDECFWFGFSNYINKIEHALVRRMVDIVFRIRVAHPVAVRTTDNNVRPAFGTEAVDD